MFNGIFLSVVGENEWFIISSVLICSSEKLLDVVDSYHKFNSIKRQFDYGRYTIYVFMRYTMKQTNVLTIRTPLRSQNEIRTSK